MLGLWEGCILFCWIFRYFVFVFCLKQYFCGCIKEKKLGEKVRALERRRAMNEGGFAIEREKKSLLIFFFFF